MKKKIMIIHQSGSIGGAGVSLYNTAIVLQSDYDVVVYCPSAPNDLLAYLKKNGITARAYDAPMGTIDYYSGGPPVLSPGFIKSLFRIFENFETWNKILECEKPDLVMVNSKIYAWSSIMFKKKGIKCICFVRETRKNAFLNAWNNLQRWFLDEFSLVLFLSKYDQEIESLKNARSEVVPDFLNIKDYSCVKTRNEACGLFGIDSNSFNILFVGGVLRIKGLHIAVKAMKYLKGLNVKLIVAGYTEYSYKAGDGIYTKFYNLLKKRFENSINKEIVKNNLQDVIVKIGVQENMPDVYALADVLIFPATVPHQARPAFEAGAMKVPVIMPDFENTLEYVSHGDNGLLFKRKDPRSLADAIKVLVKDEPLRRLLGDNNYRHALERHGQDASNKLKSIIDSVLLD